MKFSCIFGRFQSLSNSKDLFDYWAVSYPQNDISWKVLNFTKFCVDTDMQHD